ncbi:hypothetical protein [Modestobacter altitudinis]|uniref:hypothetical protein n=1 Tax=Modestobacter altitudinis TaxID=2213158 RepID=UPI00110CE502|nr:hypothetical protein [Modestobacter altitudinis]
MSTDQLVGAARRPARFVGRTDAGRAGNVAQACGALLPFLLVGMVRMGAFAEGDTFWAVVAGRQVTEARSVTVPDAFSWTIPGQLWHPNAWLYDVLLHLADAAAGRVGLSLAALLGVLVVGCGVAVAGRVLGAGAGALAVTGILGSLVLVPWLSARPQSVSYGLLLVVVALAARSVEWRGRRLAVGIAALLALSALWVNLHLAALSGVFATTAGMAVVFATRRGEWRALMPRACLTVGATVLGCLCSPLGGSVITSALATRDASTAYITEWAPLWRANALCQATWAVAALGLVLTLVAWRRAPRDVALPVWAGALLVLLVLGVSAARFSAMAAALAIPAVAVWATRTDWDGARSRGRVRFFARGVAAALAATYVVLAFLHLPDVGEPTGSIASRATVEAIPDGCRVLNEYDDGGWITYLRADDGVLVAQDGRNDAYGAAVLTKVQGLIDGDAGTLAYLARQDVRCLLLSPDRPVVAQAEAAGWRVAAADADRVLVLAPVG